VNYKPLIYRLYIRALYLLSFPLRCALAFLVRAVNNYGYAIISNNCMAGILYEIAGLPKVTVSAGLAFFGSSFSVFLSECFRGALCSTNRYYKHLNQQDISSEEKLGCVYRSSEWDSEYILFVHYDQPRLIIEKWNRRINRMSLMRPIILCSVRDGICADQIRKLVPSQRLFMYGSSLVPAPSADRLSISPIYLCRLSLFLITVILFPRPASV